MSWYRGPSCEPCENAEAVSLILDALNRSEKERSTGDTVPGLATEHYLDEANTVSSWRQYLPWLALLAALVVIGWLVWDRFSEEAPLQLQPLPSKAPSAELTPVNTLPVQKPPQVDSTAAVGGLAKTEVPEPPAPADAPEDTAVAQPAVPEDVIELYQQDGGANAVAVATEPAEEQAVEIERPQPVKETLANPPAAKSEPVSEENLDIEALVRQAEDDLENARLVEHPAPFLADLSQQKKNQIPTLMYSRHDYRSNSKTSAVTINGKSLRAGGVAGGGVKVVEVLPDSVVLSHQGTEFRLRALNSWVNL